MECKKEKIAVIGLGYVGLPLALAYAEKYQVVGFDVSEARVNELKKGNDHTLEADAEKLAEMQRKNLVLSCKIDDLMNCNHYIVTVPTPIDKFNNPDLTFLQNATKTIGSVLKKGDYVVYESTTYPGCTEEECVPILEKASGLKHCVDFFTGYSPERINPGDKQNTLTKIRKITSGCTPEAAEHIDSLYSSIIEAGTYKAPSIKVAEAAKAVENAQRDVNISFVNELALIFDRLGIDTGDVLEAASTKWNFLNFRPGLVGGHCIGVDPYYLMHKASSVGYHSEVILSGRRVNNSIARFIADKVLKLLLREGRDTNSAKALILGYTFKENCPDVRGTKVVDIYSELRDFRLDVDIFDPIADQTAIAKDFPGVKVKQEYDKNKKYDIIILAVAHKCFRDFPFEQYKRDGALIYDVKGVVDRKLVDARL